MLDADYQIVDTRPPRERDVGLLVPGHYRGVAACNVERPEPGADK